MTVKIKDLDGNLIKELKFDGVKAPKNLGHELYLIDKMQKAQMRQATSSVKTRSTITGGGRKPYRQKGTGNARRGTNRSPLRRGGAVVHGPTSNRNYQLDSNNRQFSSAIAALIQKSDKKLIGLKSEPILKTKEAKAIMDKLGVQKVEKVLMIVTSDETIDFQGFQNIENCWIESVNNFLVGDFLNAKKVILSEGALSKLEGRYQK